ncbi:MAG: GspE/PulE family protein [Opitutales bacterium]
MFCNYNDLVYRIIGAANLLDQSTLDGLKSHLKGDQSLIASVLDAGLVDSDELWAAIADHLGYEYLPAVDIAMVQAVSSALSTEVAHKYAVVPISSAPTSVSLLARDPFNNTIIDDLTLSLNKDVCIKVTDPRRVDELIEETYGKQSTSIEAVLIDLDDFISKREEDLAGPDSADIENETPIIRFVDLILQQAVKSRASDIHFEPFEEQFRIRYRTDGALHEMPPSPKRLATPVISRVKVLSNLNVFETRVPQDGRIKMTINGSAVDFRVSTLPTQFGESVVLRVLNKSAIQSDLNALSLPDDTLDMIRVIVNKANGIFVVTGPTGSGKTTTLYGALQEINTVETKILTAEDPVEYEIDGIMQVAVNHRVGLDFASTLKAFLRQDPDKIMVGEIRDLETAQAAVQASLTGHLVLTTLHTNDAPGAVTRLVDMGLEPFLISASLEAVLAQRLVRKICPNCRRAYQPNQDLIDRLELDPLEIAGKGFYCGGGCLKCSHTGYRGRIGLFEMMVVSEELSDLIHRHASTQLIREKAIEQGMRSLRKSGARAIFQGDSTIQEILRYT